MHVCMLIVVIESLFFCQFEILFKQFTQRVENKKKKIIPRIFFIICFKFSSDDFPGLPLKLSFKLKGKFYFFNKIL